MIKKQLLETGSMLSLSVEQLGAYQQEGGEVLLNK